MTGDKVRIAAIADLHYQRTSHGVLTDLFAHIARKRRCIRGANTAMMGSLYDR